MSDMLVKLYALPECYEEVKELEKKGIYIRKPIAPEKSYMVGWIKKHFGANWANEFEVAMGRSPVTCYVASKNNEMIGFACFDVTCKCFFGPTGVHTDYRGLGIGRVLLIKAMEGLREMGYGYAVIGSAGPVKFYEKTLGAMEIPDSTPGIYKNFISSNR